MFDLCWNYPPQLAAVAHVLGWQEFKVFSLNGRAALPQKVTRPSTSTGVQPAPGLPDSATRFGCWMISRRTTARPGSCPGRIVGVGCHKTIWRIPATPIPTKSCLGEAGTAVIFNSHLWHGGTENRTDRPRRAPHSAFVRRDKKQQTYFGIISGLRLPASDPAARYLLEV